MTPKDAEDSLKVQQRILLVLNKDIEAMDVNYNSLAISIEKAMSMGRMGESQLLGAKDNQKAPPKVQQDSISLGVIAKSLAKKRAIVERKERLISTLVLFIQEDQGVLRTGYTSAYYASLKTKRGGLTEKERADKFIFGMIDDVVDVSSFSSSSSSSSSAGAAAAPVSYAGTKTKRDEDVPLTKSGERDKRYAAGAK
jgi:hypothetical protein